MSDAFLGKTNALVKRYGNIVCLQLCMSYTLGLCTCVIELVGTGCVCVWILKAAECQDFIAHTCMHVQCNPVLCVCV